MKRTEQKIKNILGISDLSPEQIFEDILPRCRKEISFAEKAVPQTPDPTKKVQFLFFEPSTRTRGSNFEAAQLLGYRIDQVIGAEASALAKKETLANTARMFARYNAGIIIARTRIEGAQKFMAEMLEKEGYKCAVHNGGDGTHEHPSQTFLDLLTIDRHLNRFDGLTYGFFGDLKYGRTVHSLLTALSYRKDIKIVLVQAHETALQERYKEMFTNVEVADRMEALVDCDVIYGARIQEERFEIDKVALAQLRDLFTVTPKLLTAMKDGAIIMHPMPYVQEFPPGVRTDAKVIIDDQAWCGIPTRVALQRMSFRNLGIKEFPDESPKVILDTVEDISLEEYWESRQGRKKDRDYFDPITSSGTVIDGIPKGMGIQVESFLDANGQIDEPGVVNHIKRITKTSLPGGKEVILLENNFISPEVQSNLVSLAPSIRFNEIQKGRFKKIRAKMPSKVRGIGKCGNDICITHNDPEAEFTFVHTRTGLKCCYCGKEFSFDQVI